MTGEVSHQKRALRAELRGRRRILTSSEREMATRRLSENLVELVKRTGAKSLAAYLPASDEPNIRPFLDWAEEQKIRLLLPVSRDDGLLDWAVSSGAETRGLDGMPEPVGELLGPIAINDVDLIVVPAAPSTAPGCASAGGAATSTGRSGRWRSARRCTP